MRKILVFALFLVICGICVAQDSAEEAIILNQEMNFLKADAENPEVFLPNGTSEIATNTTSNSKEFSNKEKMDLEQFFFGTEDRVQTRAAGPRRRAAED